jgi:CDP-diglyceride synthetase
MSQQVFCLTNLVLGTWFSNFENIKTNCYLINFSLVLGTLGLLFLGMAQQSCLLTIFSLVLGTWYSDFGNVKAK